MAINLPITDFLCQSFILLFLSVVTQWAPFRQCRYSHSSGGHSTAEVSEFKPCQYKQKWDPNYVQKGPGKSVIHCQQSSSETPELHSLCWLKQDQAELVHKHYPSLSCYDWILVFPPQHYLTQCLEMRYNKSSTMNLTLPNFQMLDYAGMMFLDTDFYI